MWVTSNCYPSVWFGAPAMFHHLMNGILCPHNTYTTAYLDYIIIYSNDWQRHLQYLRAVQRMLRQAGVTARSVQLVRWDYGI